MADRRIGLVGAVILSALLSSAGREAGATAGDGWSGGERIEVAAGNAHQGPWRMNESDFDYVDDSTVAIADDGHVGVAWADQARQKIFFQMYAPDGQARFAEPVNVSAHPGIFSWLPRMVIGAGDAQRIYVLWQEIIFSGGSHGGEILFARSTDGGASFSAPLNLSNTQAGAGKGRLTTHRWDNGSLDLAEGEDGTLYAAWTEYEGRLFVSRSSDGGASFSRPFHVVGDETRPARGPSFAVEASGAVHLAWTWGEDSAADIHIATSRDGGRSFGAPQAVSSGPGHADAPKLAADSRTNLHLVFGESADGLFGQYRIRYSRRTAGNDNFSQPVTVAAPARDIESMNFPHLAIDSADRLYLAWELFPEPRHRPRGLGFTASTDGGESFAVPEIVPGSDDQDLGINGSLQGLLASKLAVNARGDAALVNSSFARGKSSHVWLWRKPAGLE
jgi:hypothetical protein